MSKVRILILEDNPERHNIFREKLKDFEVIIVERADECIYLLKSQDWDWLFLDHDLAGEEMVKSGPGTGYEVACWLEEFPENTPENVVIHSLNFVGGPKMQQAIKGSLLMQGVWLADDLKEFIDGKSFNS